MMANPRKGKATVVDDPTLVRDLSTNAVINRNTSDYRKRLGQKKRQEERNLEITALKGEIQSLKDAVASLLAIQKKK